MATYQSAAYLAQQLELLKAQSYTNWRLYVSDAGLTDATERIVAEFARSAPQTVRFDSGPGKGETHNIFLFDEYGCSKQLKRFVSILRSRRCLDDRQAGECASALRG